MPLSCSGGIVNLDFEARQPMTKSDLQVERAALEACLRSYESLIDSLGSGPEQTVILPEAMNRSEVIAQVRNLTNVLDEALVSGRATAKQNEKTLFRRIFRPRTVKLCCAAALTISLLAWGMWWIYHRPKQLALAQLRGSWQMFEVNDTGETEKQYYRTFTVEEMTTSQYIRPDRKWQAYGRTFELVPAAGFFVLKTTNLPESRPVAGAEFYVQILDGKMYEIRGIHRLDPMRKPQINLWRSVESVPTAPLSNVKKIPLGLGHAGCARRLNADADDQPRW